MKKSLVCLFVTLFLLILSGSAHAALTTIGTATYNGTDYNLIYDADGPLGPVTWLDYSYITQPWVNQVVWAATLGDKLTVTLKPGYATNLSWLAGWRLPSAAGGLGLNKTESEMGHLYYAELNNGLGGLINTEDFDNLGSHWYWSGTEYAENLNHAWLFGMGNGYQDHNAKGISVYGLAVRSGEVSAAPVPGAIFLLGSGLVGLAGLRRRREGSRC